MDGSYETVFFYCPGLMTSGVFTTFDRLVDFNSVSESDSWPIIFQRFLATKLVHGIAVRSGASSWQIVPKLVARWRSFRCLCMSGVQKSTWHMLGDQRNSHSERTNGGGRW
jgi:hypothetical protein